MPVNVPAEFITCPGANPHPDTSVLRESGSVHRIDYPKGAEAYVVIDHESVASAFSDTRLSKRLDNAPAWFREATLENSPILGNNMLLADPPEHTRLRNPISKAFLPRRIEPLRPRIQEITDDLIDAFPDSGVVDLMSAFAFALPLIVISEFLGVPPEDRQLFQEWGRVLSQSPSQQGEAGQRKAANNEVQEYLEGMLAIRRSDLREDLISDLLRAADDKMLSDEELVSTLMFLIIAGHKTTANLIGNGTYALLRHPDQLERLRSDPGLVVSAVEEFLRYEGPVDRGTLRVAAEKMRLGEIDIPKESFVHLSVAAADHDPAVFENPDRLDITRSPNRHLAFGYGPHFCAGASLARLEGHIAFTSLLRRLPVLELAVPPNQLIWVADSSVSRGLEGLPVRIDGRLGR